MKNDTFKIISIIILCGNLLYSSDLIIEKNIKINQKKLDGIYKNYIDKTYPSKVKSYYKNFIVDKHENIYKTVKSPYTGRLWLDRNLGASRVCISSNDISCYGSYFNFSELGQDICPTGYKVPSKEELGYETVNKNRKVNFYYNKYRKFDAFSSFLKLPISGSRGLYGKITIRETGNLWTRSNEGENWAWSLKFYTKAILKNGEKRFGFPVRCIKT